MVSRHVYVIYNTITRDIPRGNGHDVDGRRHHPARPTFTKGQHNGRNSHT
jgi:hypothetical protein